MVTPRTGRPRGRPKGSKNTPSLEAFVAESLVTEIPIPQAVEAPKAAPRGPWVHLKTPEERSAYARKLVAARSKDTFSRNGRKPGISSKLSVAQHLAIIEAQKPTVEKIFKKMQSNGMVPDDPMAAAALKETLTILRSQATARDKLSAARLLLDFTKAKPTAKVEHTIKSAEDFLDEMADEE